MATVKLTDVKKEERTALMLSAMTFPQVCPQKSKPDRSNMSITEINY